MHRNPVKAPVDCTGEAIAQARLLLTLPSNSSDANVVTSPSDSWEGSACAWSADGLYFAWSCSHRLIKIVSQKRFLAQSAVANGNSNNEKDEITIDAGDKVWSMAFGLRGTSGTSGTSARRRSSTSSFRYLVFDDVILAAGLRSGRIRTWDVKTGCLKLELIDHSGIISELRFAPDRSLRLVSASHDSTLKVWDFEDDGNLMKTLKSKAKLVLGCSWSQDAKLLASVGDFKTVELWNMETYTLVQRFEGHHHTVTKCDFSPDGALLATSSLDSRVVIWDVLRAMPIIELCHLRPAPSLIFAGGSNGASVFAVSFSPDGKHLGSICEDGFIRFWDIFDPDFPVSVAAIDDASCCCFSPVSGASLAIGTRRGKTLIFRSPQSVSSLQHICRLTIRRFLRANGIDNLSMIPKMTQKFLKYETL